MTAKNMQTKVPIQKKIISVSRKRQITIPLEFCKKVGIQHDVECYMVNNSIILHPVSENSTGYFVEQILADLVSQGYTGDELLKQFRLRTQQIRPAIEKILEEADEVANGKVEYSSYQDVFGSESA